MTAGAAPSGLHLGLLLPTPRDTELTARILAKSGIATQRWSGLHDLEPDTVLAAGAVMIAEEWLGKGGLAALRETLARQPPWSDLPILIVARAGLDSDIIGRLLDQLGNATLLDRPLRVAAITSAARAALRARERQYQILSQLHALESASAELAIAAQRKDEFLAMLGHELRNPLAPIRNSIHMLQQLGVGGEVQQNLLATMQRQTDHMVRLVEDLIDVARLTRGKIELQREPLVLDELVEAALALSRPMIERDGHRVRVLTACRGMAIMGDRVRLTQVFSNLLNNAAKYSLSGGSITVQVRREGGEAVLEVADRGIGIDAATLPYVFDLFVQGQRIPNRVNDGLGIGLSLVKRLVELHGGRTTAHSAGAGLGATFEVRLPLADEQAGAIARQEPADAFGDEALSSGLRVLVVDDNRDSAETLGLLLETLSVENRVVFGGPEALEAMEAWRPTAVFLDIGMPGMDGYEVARRMRARPGGERLYLVALTGWSQEQDRLRSREAGFDFHMSKPADFPELQRVLQRMSDAAVDEARA